MKKITAAIVLLCIVQSSFSQTCIGDFVFNNQSQLDSFEITHPNCTRIDGNITISITGSSVINLSGLDNLIEVDGYFRIYNTDAESIIPPANLASISGNLSYDINEKLLSIQGFPSLKSCRILRIQDCEKLESIVGFEGLNSLEGLQLANLDQLRSLPNLPNATKLIQTLNIRRCPIENFSGVDNLEEVGFLNLESLPFSSFEGLQNLKIAKDLVIWYCSAIETLEGLEKLDSIGRELHLEGNSSLRSIEALKDITTIGNIEIDFNNNLQNLDALRNLKYVRSDLEISTNSILTNIAFPSLDSVGSRLEFTTNKALKNLGDWSNLKKVNHLQIINCDSLTDLDALNSLRGLAKSHILSAKGRLDILGNEKLNDISSLENFKFDSASFVFIEDNPNLSDCNISPICRRILNDVHVVVANNAPGCNDI